MQNRTKGPEKVFKSELKAAKPRINGETPLLHIIINGIYLINALLNTGYFCYAAVNSKSARFNELKRIVITPKQVKGATAAFKKVEINKIVYGTVDIGKYEYVLFVYVIPGL